VVSIPCETAYREIPPTPAETTELFSGKKHWQKLIGAFADLPADRFERHFLFKLLKGDLPSLSMKINGIDCRTVDVEDHRFNHHYSCAVWMAAFAFVLATLRSDIGAKSAAERLPIFVNAFAVAHNAITIIVRAIQFRHCRHLLSLK
jgi:hypothetical protein